VSLKNTHTQKKKTRVARQELEASVNISFLHKLAKSTELAFAADNGCFE